MANTDTAITHISATGDIRISDVNVLKRYLSKTTIHNEKDSGLKALRDWFVDKVGPRGDKGQSNHESTTGNNQNISLGRFRDNYIYGFTISGTSESIDNKYYDNDDATVKMTGIGGKDRVYSFTLGGSTQTSRESAQFGGLSGASTSGVSSTDYSASIEHRTIGSTTDSIGFTVRVGYGGTNSRIIRNTNSDGIDDNISSSQSYLIGTKLYRLAEAVDDNVRPRQVTGVGATALSTSSIITYWDAVSNAQSYNVYRGGTRIASGITATQYTNSGLASNTTYSYTVTAVNAIGESINRSAPASATTLALTTGFTFENRMVRDGSGNALFQDAIILDSYTNFTYTFRLRLNMIRYKPGGVTENFSTEGSYVSRKYNTTTLTDRITYKNFSGIDQLMGSTTFDVIDSYDILRVEIRNRTGGALISTVSVGKNIKFGTNAVINDTNPGIGGSFTASFDITNEDYVSTSSGVNSIKTHKLDIDLGLNQDPALREDWNISASGGATSVNEGASITFNTLAYNPIGTYFWKLNPVGSTGIETADFASLSGQLATTNASNGISSFTITPTDDVSLEVNETFNVTIHKGSANGTLMATSDTITINDNEVSTSTLNFRVDVYRDVGTASFGNKGGFIRVLLKRDSVLQYGSDGKCNVTISFANNSMTTETNWNTTLRITQNQLLNDVPNLTTGIVFGSGDSGYYNITGVLPVPSAAGWQETRGCIPAGSITTVTLTDNLTGITKSGSVGTHSNGLTGQAYPNYF